jgi:dephospho-CoA kinase
MLTIGLTGGIGSGKTTVSKLFSLLGIPCYSSDITAKNIVENNADVVEEIKKTFGSHLYKGAKLNREELADIVFKDKIELSKLNAIVHPAVFKDFEKWKDKNQHAEYVLKEAAILFESGSYKDCDYIVTIVAPLEHRIEMIMKRDNISREKVLERVNNQWSDEEKIKHSAFVIHNNNKELLIPQILSIHEDIILRSDS